MALLGCTFALQQPLDRPWFFFFLFRKWWHAAGLRAGQAAGSPVNLTLHAAGPGAGGAALHIMPASAGRLR